MENMTSLIPRKGTWLLCTLLALVSSNTSYADTPPAPQPTITTSSSGRFAFHMLPSTDSEHDWSNGEGVAYELEPNGKLKELWRTSGWYSFKVYLADDGMHLVRMGPWNTGHEPAADHLAVAFFREGKILRSYSTQELVRDKSRVIQSASHYQWLADTERSGENPPAPPPELHWNDRFILTTVDGVRYTFDITTGSIVDSSTEADRAAGWAPLYEIDRLNIAVALASYPFPHDKLDEMIGLPNVKRESPSGFGGDGVTEYIWLTARNPGTGRYALVVHVKTPQSGLNYLRKPVEGEVVGLQLVFVTPDKRHLECRLRGELATSVERLKRKEHAPGTTPRQLSEQFMKSLNGRTAFIY